MACEPVQRYLLSGKFLDKAEVVDGWEKGFYITTIAGMPCRSSLTRLAILQSAHV